MSLRRVVNGIGRALIAVGTLLLLFVAYQLWGTGLHEARAQNSLRSRFEASLEATPTTAKPAPGASTTTSEAPPPPPEGEAVAVLRIPRIGVSKTIVEGVSVADLKKAPGHYPGTPMPGQPGNAAIAGHRTTYGAPFYRFDELEPGDLILVTTRQGRFRYKVDSSTTVKPTQTEVLQPTLGARLTLTTCTPRYSARLRLIITASLEGEAAPAPPPTTVPPGAAPEPLTFEEPSLSGDRSAAAPTVVWALVALLVAAVIWLLGRRWRKLWVYILGAPVFLVVLFVFFENVARLLPANI